MDNNEVMQKFMNPMTLAGLAVMGGKNLGDAIIEGSQQSMQMQEQQRLVQERQRQQQMMAQLPDLLKTLDPNNPQQVFSTLVQAGVPAPNASALTETIAKQGRATQQQQMMAQLFGGMSGGSQPAPAMPQGAAPAADVGGAGVSPSPTMPASTPAAPISAPTPTSSVNGEADRAKKAMQIGVLTGNPSLVQYGQSMLSQANQQQNNKQDRAYKIATDFDNASKDFIGIRDGYAKLRTAANSQNSTGDIQLIYSFMKTQDPTSTVREGEFATAEQAGGVSARVLNMYNKVVKGERLTPEMRQEFLTLGKKNYDNALSQHQKLEESYKKRASKFGVNPDDVITDYNIVDEAPKEAVASPIDQKALQMGISPEALKAYKAKRGIQ